MADRGTRRRVVMLVRNRFTNDTRVEQEARTLTGAGYAVTVVADAGPGLPERETRDGFGVVRVARGGPAVPGLRFVVHELRLARRLAALRPDVLHAHDSNALVPVALAARRTRVPFVYDAHDLWLGRPRRERSRLYFALGNAWYALVERLLVPRAAAVLTVSEPIARHLERRYRVPEVTLVPNYPAPELATAAPSRSLREIPGGQALDPHRPVVLYLGGLMGGRGLEELVTAMVEVPEGQLVLVGDGVLGEPLRRRAHDLGIGDRVHLLDPVPPGDVVSVAASADVGVSPIVPSCLNYRYSLPNKLFQYLAAGLPVVASDFPQVRDVVAGADAGLLVDTSRPSAIAAAIRELLADPARRAAMGTRGRAAVTDRFNWATSATALLGVYDTVVTGRPRG